MHEGKIAPSQEYEQFVKTIHAPNFPWYYQEAYDGVMMFGHNLMSRAKGHVNEKGTIESPYYDNAEKVFLSYCAQIDKKVNRIFRACINRTWYHDRQNVGIHRDHSFSHEIFLLYLNSVDGDTIVYDNQKNEVHRSSPEKDKVFIFPGMFHTQEFCKPGDIRTVLVFTFK